MHPLTHLRSDGRRIPTEYHRTREGELPAACFNPDSGEPDPSAITQTTQQAQRNADDPIAIAVGQTNAPAVPALAQKGSPVPLVIPWPDLHEAEDMGARWDARQLVHSAPWWAVWLNPGLHRWMGEDHPMTPALRRDAASVAGGCRVRLGADPGRPVGRGGKRKAQLQGAEV